MKFGSQFKALAVLAFALTCLSESVQSQRPNILLIVSEDNGPELGCYGDPYAQTPHLDQLASDGICFKRAFVPQSGCSQSRASFLTGLYPHQHGQIGLATWGFRLYNKNIPNLPRLLKKVGYRTGIIGKLHINPASAFPFDMHEIPSANFQRNDLMRYAKVASEFISADDTPFFLSVNYPDAHDPWIDQIDGLPEVPLVAAVVNPMPYMGVDSPALRELVAGYYNCMSRLDSLIGDLLNVLEESGKAENTIVIYIGDHGADMLRGKRTCFEGGLRIPMIVKWPGRMSPGNRLQMVTTLDLMPTLLTAAGAPAIESLPGKDLQPLFDGDNPAASGWREYLFAEYHTHAAAPNYFPQRSVRSDRYKLILTLLPDMNHPDYQDTIRKLHGDHERRDSKYQLDLPRIIDAALPVVRKAYRAMRAPPKIQLYDLKEDPFEFNNLATSSDHIKIKDELMRALKQWRQATADPLLDPELLKQLTEEVQSVTSKSLARKHQWQYPRYFFSESP
ncbi:MAG: sulfatase [Pirellulales bacterium]|nr:sulfatase [Pirellulales bacterium]